jgi:cytochrome c
MSSPRRIALACLLSAAASAPALAQFQVPAASKPDPAALFRNQCATCHTLNAADPPRQGPTLAGVFGRHAGSIATFHYSPGFAAADFAWDDAHLDAWLTNPQSVIKTAIMPYRQANPATRAAIIGYLKEQK